MALGLNSVAIRAPGLYGLNTQQAVAVTDPRWALEFTNFVFDEANRPTSRKGLTMVTSSEETISDDIESIGEYVENSSTTRIIAGAGTQLFEGTALTTVTGTITAPTGANWQFLNFNGKVVGIQQSHTPVVKTGSGNFADIVPATGALPTGNAGISSWGRLFITDSDEVTIKFCDLLDETNWSNAGSGSLDTTEVWPDGSDHIVGLGSWNNKLAIFGSRSVLIYTGAEDPTATTFALEDIIPKAGCVGRDSIQAIGTDLLYLSKDGLRSLERGIEFSTLPLTELSTNIKDDLISDISAASDATIKATYNPDEGMYIARIGAAYWYWDTKTRLEDGNLRASRWFGIGYLSTVTCASDNTTYFGTEELIGSAGIASYSGFQDRGEEYQLIYRSTWMDLDNDQIKIPKSLFMTVITEGPYTINLQWSFDFSDSRFAESEALPAGERTGAEWDGQTDATTGDSFHEWGTAEWSGGSSILNTLKFHMRGSGHRIQVGYTVNIDGREFSLQEVRMLSKQGRVAA